MANHPGWHIAAYVYRAALYCGPCVLKAMTPKGHNGVASLDPEATLDLLAEAAGIDRQDEWTFDTDSFPKVAFRDQLEPGDHCGGCHGVLIA